MKRKGKSKDRIPERFFPGGFKYTEMECNGANARSTGTHDCRWRGALRLHSRPDVAQLLCRSAEYEEIIMVLLVNHAFIDNNPVG